MEYKWLFKGLVESVLVVGSILMALAVDEWSENRGFTELADQSLRIFEREISQNRARLEDGAPYHQGIGLILAQMSTQTEAMPEGRMDARRIMEGFEAPVLLSTAWETALATGALTHMDFEVVSALSLTYSIQQSFRERNRMERPRLASPESLSHQQERDQLREAYEYVARLTREESELMTVYEQALGVILRHRGIGRTGEPHSDEEAPGDESGD